MRSGELYNLETDPSEQYNLAGDLSAKVTELQALLATHAIEVGQELDFFSSPARELLIGNPEFAFNPDLTMTITRPYFSNDTQYQIERSGDLLNWFELSSAQEDVTDNLDNTETVDWSITFPAEQREFYRLKVTGE